MQRSLRFGIGLIGIAAVAAACSAAGGGSQFTTSTSTGPGKGGNGNGGASQGGNGQGAGDIIITSGGGTTGTVTGQCNNSPDMDGDGDGWTGNEGDCNDCDPNVNPGAVEVVDPDPMAIPVDEDCDGTIDNVAQPCDGALALASNDAMDAARAVELCQQTVANPASKKDKKWGVVSARWSLPDGTPAPSSMPWSDVYHLGHGMLPAFGPNVHVQAGNRMLGVSSGAARQPSDADYKDVGGFIKGIYSDQPTGFPKESPSCGVNVITGKAQDGAAVEIQIRTPTNAKGFTFDFNFFTYEWPGYVCTQYNDFFVAQLQPIPAGQPDGNISFDSVGNPVSVNNAFVDVCSCQGQATSGCGAVPPNGCCVKGKPFACALGTAGLLGTGFEGHGSTGWLVTKAPVKGGETITMRWTTYDAGDGQLDSTTLIDNWQWIATGGTVTVGTDPIKTPQ